MLADFCSFPAARQKAIQGWWLLRTPSGFMRGGLSSCPSRKPPCTSVCLSRMTRALVDSLGPEWRLKLPSIPLVPVTAQKRWDSLPLEYHKESAKSKFRETTSAKSRGKLRLPAQSVTVSLWPLSLE